MTEHSFPHCITCRQGLAVKLNPDRTEIMDVLYHSTLADCVRALVRRVEELESDVDDIEQPTNYDTEIENLQSEVNRLDERVTELRTEMESIA